jgi:membrane associated rhomboid family serine protease
MMKKYQKALVALVLTLCWVFIPITGYSSDDSSLLPHLLYPLGHANLWHLVGNLFILWLLRGETLRLWQDYAIAVACSFLPVIPGLWDFFSTGEPLSTVGFSGVLFAELGIRWGAWCRQQQSAKAYLTFCERLMPFVLVGFLIPHINWSIHLYCVIAGLVYGRCRG